MGYETYRSSFFKAQADSSLGKPPTSYVLENVDTCKACQSFRKNYFVRAYGVEANKVLAVQASR